MKESEAAMAKAIATINIKKYLKYLKKSKNTIIKS